MGKKKKRQIGIVGLLVSLLVVVVGSVLFVGAVSGWFSEAKVELDAEYFADIDGFLEIDAEKYDEMINAKKSFIVFVDQNGCNTADRLREYVLRYAKDKGITISRIMFADMKESLLHNSVKYYPSVAIIEKGDVRTYLRADSDEDAVIYNDYEEFKTWMEKSL